MTDVKEQANKLLENEKKYSAFLMDTEPDSKERLSIHSDRKIDLQPGDSVKVKISKNQKKIGE